MNSGYSSVCVCLCGRGEGGKEKEAGDTRRIKTEFRTDLKRMDEEEYTPFPLPLPIPPENIPDRSWVHLDPRPILGRSWILFFFLSSFLWIVKHPWDYTDATKVNFTEPGLINTSPGCFNSIRLGLGWKFDFLEASILGFKLDIGEWSA